jgi:PhoPQ-activated pathogenicity-related protein
MVIIGGNDQFFPASGSHYFFDEIPDPKFMWYVYRSSTMHN